MSAYPDVLTEILPTLPMQYSTSQAILKTQFDNGVESRRLLWTSVRRNVQLDYSAMTFGQANELRRFYELMQGPFTSFSFFFPQEEDYVDELVGTIVELETPPTLNTLSLPSLDASSRTLYQNTIALVEGVHWTFLPAGGDDGEDEAALISVPNLGDIYTFTFTGRLKIKARFNDSPIVFNDIKKYWSSTTVELLGLEPEA